MGQDELKKKVLEFLKGQNYCVLSTFSNEYGLTSSTMMYIIEDNFTFSLACINDTQKVNNIGKNNNVSIVVGFGPEPITVQAGGKAEIIQDVSEELFYKLMHKLPHTDLNKWPILKLAKHGFVTIKFQPEWMSFLNLDYTGHKDTYFEGFQKVL